MLSGNLFQFEEYHSQNHQPDPQLTMAMDARAVGGKIDPYPYVIFSSFNLRAVLFRHS